MLIVFVASILICIISAINLLKNYNKKNLALMWISGFIASITGSASILNLIS